MSDVMTVFEVWAGLHDAEPTPIYDALVEDSRVVQVTYDGVPYGAHTIGELREMQAMGQLFHDQLLAALEGMETP